MSKMNNISKKHSHLDLLNCQKWLQEKYGRDAPSYMTLRRWAEAEKLAVAERTSTDQEGEGDTEQRRKIYSTAAVERFFLQTSLGKKLTDSMARERSSQNTKADDQIRQGDESIGGAAMGLLMDTLAQILKVQAEQSVVLQECKTGLNRLESLRTNLMLKYDAQTTNQAEIIEGLRAQVKSTSKSVDLEQSILRLGILVGRVKDSIDDLATQEK